MLGTIGPRSYQLKPLPNSVAINELQVTISMPEEQLQAFLEKIKTDTSLQEKLKSATDVEAVIAIAKAESFELSADAIIAAQSAPQELSDEDLEGVSGGYGMPRPR